MRNILVFLIFVSMFLFLIGGQKLDAGVFSVSPLAGFLWGKGEEIVYSNTPENAADNTRKSELLWDFKPLFYLGVDAGFGPRYLWAERGFCAGISLKYGFPLETGILEDRDWLDSDASYLTHYSKHDAFSRGSPLDIFSGTGTFTADISAGYSWAFASVFWLKVFGELSYNRYSWMSRDGYYQYAEEYPVNNYEPWTPDLPKVPFSGRAIAYTQNWLVFSPGFSAGIKLNDYISLSFLAAFSPFIYAYCRDDHFVRGKGGIVFLDYLSGGLFLRGEIELKICFDEDMEFFILSSVRELRGAKGDTYQSEGGGLYTVAKGAGGGGYSFCEFSAGVNFVLR